MLSGREIYARNVAIYAPRSASHPDGTVETYRDFVGRVQTRVVGPRGRVLVTNDGAEYRPGRAHRVWRSDALTSILETSDFDRALRTACAAAGLDPSALEFGVVIR